MAYNFLPYDQGEREGRSARSCRNQISTHGREAMTPPTRLYRPPTRCIRTGAYRSNAPTRDETMISHGRAVLALVLLSVGCGADTTSREGEGTVVVTDSAGISIITTNAGVARAEAAWSIDTIPDLQIGVWEGNPMYEFHNITGITATPDGEIWAYDGSTRQVRRFTPEGRFLAAFGRRGRGPGEFLSGRLIPMGRGDRVGVWDLGLRRLSYVRADSGIVTSVQVSDPQSNRGSLVPLGSGGSNILFFDSGVLMIGITTPQPERARFLTVDGSTGRVQGVHEFIGRSTFTDLTTEIPAVIPVPYQVRPSGAAGPHAAYIHDARSSDILEFDWSMELKRIFRVSEAVHQVNDADITAYVDFLVAQAPDYANQIRRRYQGIPGGHTMPAFEAVRVDDRGWVWGRLYRPLETGAAGLDGIRQQWGGLRSRLYTAWSGD